MSRRDTLASIVALPLLALGGCGDEDHAPDKDRDPVGPGGRAGSASRAMDAGRDPSTPDAGGTKVVHVEPRQVELAAALAFAMLQRFDLADRCTACDAVFNWGAFSGVQ